MPRLSPLAAALACLAVPFAASAQSITLTPNTVSGTVGFANINQDVLTELSAARPGRANVQIYSTAPNGNYVSQTNANFSGNLSTTYSIQAESNAGVGQVSYFGQEIFYYGSGSSYVIFPSQDFILQPPAQMPDGATVNYSELVTIHHFMFGTDSTCATPVLVSSGLIVGTWGVSRFSGPTSSADLIEPNGEPTYANGSTTVDTGTITLTSGNDPYSNTENIQLPVDVSPAGDTLVNHCIVFDTGSGGGTSSLAELNTPISFTGGYTLGSSPYSMQAAGPDSNTRDTHDDGSTGSLDFINLVLGDWTIEANLLVYQNGIESLVSPQSGTPASEIPLTTGGLTDGSQMIDGVEQWPFVFDTAQYTGSVTLYDAYAAAHPNSPSSLSSLLFAEQYDQTAARPYGPASSTYLTAQCVQGGTGYSSFPGHYSASTGELLSSYSIPVGLTYNQPENCPAAPYLNLLFSSLGVNTYGGDPTGYGNGLVPSDPGFRQGTLFLQPLTNPASALSAGDVRGNDLEYCTNEVVVQIQSATGAFINPSVSVSGSFSGTDFAGNQVGYQGSGSFSGTPYAGYNNSASYKSASASSGSISLPLPQGNWVLSASATFVAADGTTSTGSFANTTLDNVGCGERITLVPGLTVSLNPPDACDAPVDGQVGVALSGTVNSSGAAISHVWYTVGDGAPVDICLSQNGQSCPSTFSLFVPLADGSNSITVSATSPFVTGTSAISETTSCNDGGCGQSCVEPPPSCTTVSTTPAEDVYGLVSYEDLWPDNGDLDFNDVGLGYNYQVLFDASSSKAIGLTATFAPLSMGAELNNGLYLHLPIAIAAAGTATLSTGSGNALPLTPLAALGTSGQLTDAVYQLTPDFRDLFGGAAGFINTNGAAVTPGQTLVFNILFGSPIALGQGGIDLSAAPFDLFLARTGTESHQIHFPGYDGSATGADSTLFHTGDDGSNEDLTSQGGANNTGRWFVNHNGLPFALALPQLADWPTEKTSIENLYPELNDFATSGGTSDAQWYDNEVPSYAWQTSLHGPPAPPSAPPDPTSSSLFSSITICGGGH